MDAQNFDRATRTLARGRSRRTALRLLTAGVLGPALAHATDTPMAARNKHKKGRCRATWADCTIGGKPCCAGDNRCCLPYDPHGLGEDGPYCTAKENVCCTAEAGGGSCGRDELCCSTTPRYRGVNDYCEKAGGECCDDPVGGSCAPGFSCCVDPEATPQYTCCADPARSSGGVSAAQSRAGRNFQLRNGAARS